MTTYLSPATAPPPPLQRPRVLMVATGFASAATLVLFGGLFGIYLSLRASAVAAGQVWLDVLPKGPVTLELTQANVMFVTMIMSAVTVQWAVKAIRNDDRHGSYVALGITMLLGLAFVNQMAFVYSAMKLDIATGPAAVLVYAITGAHVVMVILAVIYVLLMAFRALGGSFTSRQYDGLAAAALFWHTTVAVYALIWILIYVTK